LRILAPQVAGLKNPCSRMRKHSAAVCVGLRESAAKKSSYSYCPCAVFLKPDHPFIVQKPNDPRSQRQGRSPHSLDLEADQRENEARDNQKKHT
jgi:hypothetical protein